MGHITNEVGQTIPWEEVAPGRLPLQFEKSYQSLLSSIIADPVIKADQTKSTAVFYEDHLTQQVWEFSIPRNKIATDEESLHALEPVRTFKVHAGTLCSRETIRLPRHTAVKRIHVGRHVRTGAQRHTATRVAECKGIMSLASQYEWRDGKQFFDTSTAHIRRLLTEITPEAHKSKVA
jgi:hypothetical protein